MNYIRGAVSAISAPYQYYSNLPPINPATLTGAIDVIVVERPGKDGNTILACSPFHVRFGKWQVLRPGEKKVNVFVNGRRIPFNMKIGEAGEAFFIFKTDGDVPEDLITSPLLEPSSPESTAADQKAGRFGAKEGGQVDVEPRVLHDQSGIEPEFLDLDASSPPADTVNFPVSEHLRSEPAVLGSQDDSHYWAASPSTFLRQTTQLSKASLKATIEHERYQRNLMKDKLNGIKNSVHDLTRIGRSREDGGEVRTDEGLGDEALPDVKDGVGEPPGVIDTGDAMLDMAGYHSRERSDRTVRSGSRSSSESLLDELKEDQATSERPHSPMSRSHSDSPDRTPEASRSPSPIPFPRQHSPSPMPFSDTSNGSLIPQRTVSQPPQEYSWEWGAFPQPSPMKTKFTSTDHDRHPFDPHRSFSVPPFHDNESSPSSVSDDDEDKKVFGSGGRLTADERNGRRFLIYLEGREFEFELSICGQLTGTDEVADANTFKKEQVSYRRFVKDESIVYNPDLVIRWADRYISRTDMSPLMDSLVSWRNGILAVPSVSFPASEEEPLSSSDEYEPSRFTRIPSTATLRKSSNSSWVRWWNRSRGGQEVITPRPISSADPPLLLPVSSAQSTPPQAQGMQRSVSEEPSSSLLSDPIPSPLTRTSTKSTQFAKTLRLTSDQLKSLELKSGSNTITFSLSSSGVVACTAQIFLWDYADHIVISDIDGTITKSDALGHVFTMIGRDWTHIGVAKLYTDICRNGYKIMYLTSRAIGQADSTRDYLKGIKQNDYQLPDGPVIMSPDRLMASLHREVIMRKPEIFKMACLRDIQRLFGEAVRNPFYAGFGNRITDALSYRSVNVPSARIFTIDSTGEVKMELLELAGYKSSYIHMTDLVDQMFPPVHRKVAPEFTDFNYWKTPLPDFPLPDLDPPSPALSARSDTSNQSTFARLRNFSLGRQSGKQLTLPRAVQGNGKGGEDHLRQISSYERLSSRLSGSHEESIVSDSQISTLVSDWSDSERGSRAGKMKSMVGLPGSHESHGSYRYGYEAEPEDGEEGEVEGEENEAPYDDEETTEETFDEDLLATGEMENVPFL